MQELVREYLGELRGKQKKRRRVGMIVAAFAVIIVGGVIWGLIQSGIAMTGEPRCGVEEHTHSDACYTSTLVCGQEESAGHQHTDDCYETQSTLVCGLEESEPTEESEGHVHGEECYATEQVLVCGQEESAGHSHTDGCYENQQTCGKEEHIHNDYCYIDTNADVEDAAAWDAQYKDVEWKEAWGEDLVTAAKAQVGYKESTKNYTVAEDGNHKGYTRYGQFIGDVYTDWDAPFVNFCMHYAGLEASNLFPSEKVTAEWYDKFIQADANNQNYITAPEGYEPKAGDLIFFNKEGEETAFQMGVVSSYNNEKHEIEVIEGNSGNEVKENKYDAGDKHIASYLMISELEKVYKDNGEEKTPAEEAAPEVPAEEAVTEETPEETAEQEETPAYEEKYEDDTIVINVSAAEGVVPEGAELSVTPIEQKEVTREMSDEEAAEVEKVNEQYELTNQKLLEESEKKQETLEGFLAYDICFIVDGEEVEPSGDVKVTMDFKEATKPEGVSENATVAVNHLKEDESAADGIKVEDLTEKEDTTIATAEADASVEKIELITDCFSTFTITWVWNGIQVAHTSVQHVTEEGISLGGTEEELTLNSNKQNLLTMLGKEFTKNGTTYTANKINLFVRDRDLGEITSATCKINSELVPVIEFFNLETLIHSFVNWELTAEDVVLRIEYIAFEREIEGIEIKDNKDGTLGVVLGKDESGVNIASTIAEAEKEGIKVNYIWEKCIGNGDEFKEVEEKRQGTENNVSDDGKTLNIAIDDGGLKDSRKVVKYRVRVVIGEKESGKEYITPDFSVPYFAELQNGSFEYPIIASGTYDNQHTSDELEVSAQLYGKFFGWRTTASDNKVEIARVNGFIIDSSYQQVLPFRADEGQQFAELNATEVGSLYQDVLTSKTTPLYYYFSHRARTNVGTYVEGEVYDENGNLVQSQTGEWTNKMYVVIIPTSVAEAGIKKEHCHCGFTHVGAIDTQEEIECVMANQEFYENTKVKESIARNGRWSSGEGTYTPESSLTRFFFVSGETSKVNDPIKASHGNFLDNIWFNQTPPPAKAGKFSIWLDKTISGDLTNEERDNLLKKLTFNICIKDSKNNDVTSNLLGEKPYSIKGDAEGWEWNENEDGSLRGTYIYNDINIESMGDRYTVSITESGEKVEGYTVEPILAVSGGTVAEDGKSTNVGEKDAAHFVFANPYVSKKVTSNAVKKISFTKIWEDFGVEGGTRPTNLIVTLNGTYKNEKQEDVVIEQEDLEKLVSPISQQVDSDNNWMCEWANVPVYYDGNVAQPINWYLSESSNDSKFGQYNASSDEKTLEEPTLPNAENELPECEKNENHSITNTLDGSGIEWEFRKESTSAQGKGLAGATFVLREKGNNLVDIATGSSTDPDGKIIWELKDNNKEWSSLTGDYVISETKAPEGFSRSMVSWEVKLVNGIPNIDTEQYEAIRKDDESDGIVFYIANTPLYSLPESGGSGIYWYMFSGILLMAGAALITYKKRCREVLRS